MANMQIIVISDNVGIQYSNNIIDGQVNNFSLIGQVDKKLDIFKFMFSLSDIIFLRCMYLIQIFVFRVPKLDLRQYNMAI